MRAPHSAPGLVDHVRALVEAGADLAARDETGNTALMNAAYFGRLSSVAWLLEHGPLEINARNKDGQTALSWARQRGHAEVAALLDSKGATE